MNEENEWDHRIEAAVKEGPADCIRIDEIAAALKKMKRHKATGMWGLVAEMKTSTGDIGTQWILDLCNGTVKEGCIPEDWKSSMVLPIHKGKGDPMECGSYRGIKLLKHAMKVVERIFKNRILQQIDIDDMQFGFMKGKGTIDDSRNRYNDWVKKFMEYEVEGASPRGRPKKTWREIVKKTVRCLD